MQNRFGCIELPENCDIKIILLVYHNNSFFGSIPNNGEEEEAPTAANLAGNLTRLTKTLKDLNDIVKSTDLTQEQKLSELSRLLENNPEVARLLLKFRTS